MWEHGESGQRRRGKRQGTPLRTGSLRKNEEFTLDDFQVIRKITRLFGRVHGSRQTLDGVIDRCAAMHNIRQAVLHYRRQLNQQNIDPRHRRAALNRGVEYLERYYMLIAFTAYLESDAFKPSLLHSTEKEVLPPLPEPTVGGPPVLASPGGIPVGAPGGVAGGSVMGFPSKMQRVSSVGSLESYDGTWKLQSPAELQFGALCTPGEGEDGEAMSFKGWLRRRPEIRQMKWNMRLRPFRVFTVPETRSHAKLPAMISHDQLMEVFVHSRRGQVLNHDTILKMYFFPGQKRTGDHFPIPGAPNVCKVEGVHVHSTATPTVDGVREVLSHLRAGAPELPCSMDSCSSEVRQSLAVVTDLREEVVVYIKGRPFVVREIQQPASTLKLAGIEGPVVEALEAQLKLDILSEAEQSGGRMLLHREELNTGTGDIDVIGYWEEVTAADVVTPADVYSQLKEEGFLIDYKRICLTRERPPLASDLDAIKKRVDIRTSTDQPVEYLFVSHTGYGGVAYAMAIATLCLETVDSGAAAQARGAEAASEAIATPTLLKDGGWEESRAPLEAAANGGIGSAGESPTNRSPLSVLAKEELLRAGEWRDILSLVRVLVQGPTCKADVDAVIDRCSSAGRLREDALAYKKKIDEESEEDKRAYMHDMAIKALRRYSYLITFRSYLCGQQMSKIGRSASKESFDKWLKRRPELGHLLEHLKLQ